MKDELRPIYSELKGMLSQAPPVDKYLYDQERPLWEGFNKLLDKLTEITKDDNYRDFKLTPQTSDGYQTLSAALYRGKVSGLISRLHGTFFSEESEPFSGSPSTVVSQTNNQSVTTQLYVQLGIDLKTALDNAKNENEKTFINKLMEKVGTVKNYIDFLILAISTASQFGVTMDRIHELFGR